MPKLLIVVVSLLAVALLAACGQAEDSSPTATPTPAAEPTPTPIQPNGGGGGGGGEGTPVPILTPFPSPPPVPADWANYTDIESRLAFRYPNGWYVDPVNGRVLSWDPATWNGRDYPPDGILVEISISSEPTDASEFRPPEATDTTFAGEPAWEIITVYRAAEPGRVTRSHAVVATHDGYAFSLVAFFAQDNPDEVLFSQLVSSFRFID